MCALIHKIQIKCLPISSNSQFSYFKKIVLLLQFSFQKSSIFLIYFCNLKIIIIYLFIIIYFLRTYLFIIKYLMFIYNFDTFIIKGEFLMIKNFCKIHFLMQTFFFDFLSFKKKFLCKKIRFAISIKMRFFNLKE